MSKLKKVITNGHIQVSMATGISIIVMAYVSRRVLPEPMGYLYLAFPPFLMTIYEALSGNKKRVKYCKTPYWVAAIFLATIIVIAVNAI